MIKKVLNWALGLGWLGPVGDYLNGKKTITGIIFLILAGLSMAPNYIPCDLCPVIASGITEVLAYIGVTLSSFGIAHKAVKK